MTDSAWDSQQEFADTPTIPRTGEQAILTRYLPLVKRAACHLRSQVSACFDQEDMEQVGMMGLLEAWRRYGSEPDAQFESYAFKRIRGAMLDELRRLDWRPRQLRQQVHGHNQVQRELHNRLGRAPSEQELATALDCSVDEVRQLSYASQAEALQSLEEWLENGGKAPTTESDDVDMAMTISKVLATLDKREQLLLALYYQQELNMKEIALVLGLTESRVCQLHKQCVLQLKQRLVDSI
ncbi:MULTISPECIES: lateral flagellar system RNA polymerase sigma factor LafS [Aeromonas]|uniref:lateral flagellar system RNA polymerase sigma factor LafS n=1 Tax=Aeromonas TaxID=642 RepID=UPI00111B36A9|nr:lateral flagellar system RNA polymerase sigma factor LafS [Aeromonas veronii]EKP0293673.1 lateral flagellar system RNA polymerase sigma factor LafS [Aeromonas veronii]MBW3780996.1 FliA/WhiG family RNA polymerase sigma factor [Aeromonas veronii]MCF5898018.1 lateral flagellar system RNA polymerase sigma factor LafS [Aeromonas veronii]MCX0422333.1 lateral flagellar system RNA polymerase sigma factor LafS [Aeromonas veronii]TNI75762.1 RNA polymerase sigma factor FliA [Aeromonas veronii]